MKFTKSKAALGVLLLMGAVACESSEKSSSPWLSPSAIGGEAAPRVLFDSLDVMQIGGLAQEVTQLAGEPKSTVVFSEDFEGGELGVLRPFGGFEPSEGWVDSSIQWAEGSGALSGEKSVQLRGGAPHGVSLRTKPIPVTGMERFKLSYLIEGESVKFAQKSSYGAASVIWYRIRGDGANAEAVLVDAGQDKVARLSKKLSSFWIPNRYGNTPKVKDEAYFSPPPEATHLVVSFDLSRPEDDRQVTKSRGVVRFDDIVLEKSVSPLNSRHQKYDDGIMEAHPLKVVVEKAHEATKRATERRYALYAPAPSTLAFTAVVPEAGVLSLGYTLTEDARASDDSVTFEVLVEGADGQSEVLHTSSVDYDDVSYWKDVDIKLDAYAGKTVKITLQTSSDRPAELYQLPEAAAVWSYPTLHSRKSVGRNYILVAFDTLSAKRMSTYGYSAQTTPEFSRVAKEGVLFKRALSPSAWTLASFSSMLTGLDAARHRAGERQYGTQAWRRPLASSFVTLAEQFRQAGWETRAWINNPYLTKEFGLEQGYSHFVDYNTRSAREAFKPAWEDIQEYFKEPVGYDRFVFVHIMDPHGPYQPNSSFRSQFVDTSTEYDGPFVKGVGGQDFLDLTQGKLKPTDGDKKRLTEMYQAVVNYADHMMGNVFDATRKVSREDGYVFLVTADHGEELWDHDLFEHGHTMYDELLSVPLLAYVPGKTKKGSTIDKAVASFDVMPTLLELAGIEAKAEINAQSLTPYFDGQEPGGPRTLYGHQMLYGTQRNSIEKDGMKLIYNQKNTDSPQGRSPRPKVRFELYDLKNDPNEQKNLFSSQRPQAEALMAEMIGPWSRSLGGHYVLYFNNSDGKSHRIKGQVALSEGQWMRYSNDFVWPLPEGRAGQLQFRVRTLGQKSVVNFEINGPQGLIAFKIDKGNGPVKVENLTMDGEPIDMSLLQIGESAQPVSLDNMLKDEVLLTSHSALQKQFGGKPTLFFGLLQETPELVGTTVNRVSDEISAELEALGYQDSNKTAGDSK